VSRETGKAVDCSNIEEAGQVAVSLALKNLDRYEERRILSRARRGEDDRGARKKMYFQYAGATESEARTILLRVSHRSATPEAIRIAHIIASGIVGW